MKNRSPSIRDRAKSGKTPNEFPELLSVRDLMIFTDESEFTWRQRITRGEIPVVRLGTNVRVRRRDLERYLDEHTTPRR